MEGLRSVSVRSDPRLSFTAENPFLSSNGSEQRICKIKSPAKTYSTVELAVHHHHITSSQHTRRSLREEVLECMECNSNAIDSAQRCYICKKFQNGMQQTYKFPFSIYFRNYAALVLQLFLLLASINSSASYNNLCQDVTWLSDIKCNCSTKVLSNSSCEQVFKEQNETSYSCQCGDNIMCNINVLNSNGSQAMGNCSCESGYTGPNCEMLLLNKCENVTCFNGGTCRQQPSNASYLCQCITGFIGVHCEQNINICNVTDFCQNNGSCVNDGLGGYTCNCTEGYESVNCSMSNCSMVECANGGICHISNDKWACNCTEGYEGRKCETDIDECNNRRLCLNNSTCSNTPGSFKCLCTSGYTGRYCESNIDECNSTNMCLNNATCTNFEGGYRCNCPDGYIGADCSSFDGCLSNPCMHNGSCVHVNDTLYYCDCLTGFMGLHCEQYNSCISLPCGVHGICNNEGDSYECSCNSSFTGAHCNLTNPCSVQRCEHGGSCMDLLQNASSPNGDCAIPGNCFSCICSTNFTGSYCQTQIGSSIESPESVAPVGLIVGLTVGLFFLVFIIVGIILILIVLNKRQNLGTYRPSRQEVANARLEINGGLKPPPEERLI